MQLYIGKEVVALQRMTMRELRAKYADVFAEETRATNRIWMVKRIAWRLQALAEGDLSERAQRRAAELANDADLRTTVPKHCHEGFGKDAMYVPRTEPLGNGFF